MSKLILTKSRVNGLYYVKTLYRMLDPTLHGEFSTEQEALKCFDKELDYIKNGREITIKESEEF